MPLTWNAYLQKLRLGEAACQDNSVWQFPIFLCLFQIVNNDVDNFRGDGAKQILRLERVRALNEPPSSRTHSQVLQLTSISSR